MRSASIIYLAQSSRNGSSNLPSEIERAALMLRFIWFFNFQGLPEIAVTNYFCELLPHIFTLTFPFLSKWKGGNFLWHFLLLLYSNTFLLGSGILCVARTFLSLFLTEMAAIERPVWRKVNEKNLLLLLFGRRIGFMI